MPPRGRKKRNDKLPPHIAPMAAKLPDYVYYDPRGKGRWTTKLYDKATGKTKEHPLSLNASATMQDIWRAYEGLTGVNHNRFKWLSNEYQASPAFAKLADSTKRDYKICHAAICNRRTKSGTFLGDVQLTSWSPGVVRKYRDARGEESVSRANHELRYIKRVFSWGYEYEHVSSNPGRGIKKLTEAPRRHYATHADYQFAISRANSGDAPGYIWPFMEIAYLCRLRKSEVLDLTLADELKEGINIRRRKGSRDNITTWNPRLKAAWMAAKALLTGKPQKMNPAEQTLFIGPDYARLKESTLDSAWQRLMDRCEAAAEKEGKEFTRFTPHDLKRKGVSDTPEAQKLAGSGHKTEQVMRDHYDVLPPKVDPSNT